LKRLQGDSALSIKREYEDDADADKDVSPEDVPGGDRDARKPDEAPLNDSPWNDPDEQATE